MARIIIYDTTNFIDFPIGGQLTSVRNFLKYVVKKHPEKIDDILLVGVTTRANELGTVKKIDIDGAKFKFLAVAIAETDLSKTKKSLRLEFSKGILKYGRYIKISKDDINYIQTPEAYGVIKVLNPKTKVTIFSHGSYANMERGFRFFNKFPIIQKGFVLYLKSVIKGARKIFVIDDDSYNYYKKYQKNLVKVSNSIVLPDDFDKFDAGQRDFEGRLLFVGRLSKDKGVSEIIKAVYLCDDNYTLTIVGDGEFKDELLKVNNECISKYGKNKTEFVGAVEPASVGDFMRKSDILIMNSAFEGVPMTILEALSHGLPVISTNVGGIGKTVDFGADSTETNGSASSIKDAIYTVKENFKDMSEHAHSHAKKYDYLVVNDIIYENLIRN